MGEGIIAQVRKAEVAGNYRNLDVAWFSASRYFAKGVT